MTSQHNPHGAMFTSQHTGAPKPLRPLPLDQRVEIFSDMWNRAPSTPLVHAGRAFVKCECRDGADDTLRPHLARGGKSTYISPSPWPFPRRFALVDAFHRFNLQARSRAPVERQPSRTLQWPRPWRNVAVVTSRCARRSTRNWSTQGRKSGACARCCVWACVAQLMASWLAHAGYLAMQTQGAT